MEKYTHCINKKKPARACTSAVYFLLLEGGCALARDQPVNHISRVDASEREKMIRYCDLISTLKNCDFQAEMKKNNPKKVRKKLQKLNGASFPSLLPFFFFPSQAQNQDFHRKSTYFYGTRPPKTMHRTIVINIIYE